MFYTYILHSETLNKFYVGHTNNLVERIGRHNRGGNKFTSKGQPWKLVFSEEFNSKEEAHSRERQIKNWKSKIMIQKLISSAG